ncbi:MAG: DUF373 family protein [Candidatus Altiarchaeota archaeon]
MVQTLVICVDRDDDLGRKANVKGPVLGAEDNLKAASKLALTDPTDSDVNAIFSAVKIAKAMATEVVTLTGDYEVGVISDKKLSNQLDQVLKKFNPSSVILVSDGAEDEQILPIIQSRVKIMSVHTVIVQQSQELEKAYFKITRVLQEISEEPTLARLIFGIPGVTFLLLSLFGFQAISLIIGIIGLYFIIKAFGWEEEFFYRASAFVRSLSVENIKIYTYPLAAITLFVAAGYAIEDISNLNLSSSNLSASITSIAYFISSSPAIDFTILTFIIILVGQIIDELGLKRYIQIRRYLILLGFLGAIYFIGTSGARLWIDETYQIGTFLSSVILSILLFTVWIKATEYFFYEEIQAIRKIKGRIKGREVFSLEGKLLGRVDTVQFDGMDLEAIKIGRKRFGKDVIVSIGERITVNMKMPK